MFMNYAKPKAPFPPKSHTYLELNRNILHALSQLSMGHFPLWESITNIQFEVEQKARSRAETKLQDVILIQSQSNLK